jgi:TonB-linked SusC/RagA family outer membrane protein
MEKIICVIRGCCKTAHLRKIWMTMKLTVVLILLAIPVLMASEAYSQNTRLTLKLEEASVKEVLAEIENNSEFFFLYNSKLVDVNRMVSMDIKDQKLNDILNDLFRETDVTYAVVDRQVVLTNKANHDSFKQLGTNQPQKVSGVVTTANGEPLPGVTVLVKGTPLGTLTDTNGKYTLTELPAGSILVFSFVGMQALEVETAGRSVIDVTMVEESIGLDEVVVIGYGTQKKRDVSTAISSVSAENLKDKPVANFSQAIQGQMAGIRIMNSNNAPGGGTNIIIRGLTSINASNNPLLVIDGFPLKDGFDMNENPLNTINPADIQSIEVLKDASSSAIYGAQAANGVILITTKKGSTGKPTVNLNVSTGFENMTHKVRPLNRADFIKFLDDARAQAYIVEDPNLGTNNPNAALWKWTDPDETRIYNWMNYSTMVGPMTGGGTLYERWCYVIPELKAIPYDTDWQDAATRTGSTMDVQLSTTGGTNDLKYMVSAGVFSQNGIVDPASFKRYSFRSNIDFKINDWFKTGLMLAPTLQDLSSYPNYASLFNDLMTMPPIYRPFDDNGNIENLYYIYDQPPMDYRQWNIGTYVNPYHAYMIENKVRNIRNISTIFAEINLIKGLVLRTEFHNEINNRELNYFLPNSVPTAYDDHSRSLGRYESSNRFFWNSQSFLTYTRAFGKHSINAVLGYSAEEAKYKSVYIQKYDFATDRVTTLNQGVTILNVQNDSRTNRSSESMIGSYARAMYNYGGKYYFTTSIRRDGSSKFGADKKWGIFPSVSAAWRISDEAFFQPLKIYINDLKLRGGWGIIGNAGIGNYQALSTLSSTSYGYGSESVETVGYEEAKVSNSKLGWESTTDYGVGADIQFLTRRIELSVDYYYKLTENMLFAYPLPIITGFSSYMRNIGSMRNRGFEYLLTTRNFVGNFNWRTSFNLSYFRNRVLSTGASKRPLITGDSYTIEGKPLAGLWGGLYLGPYRDWEDVKTNPIVNPDNPRWMYRSIPGTQKFYDVDGDGVITSSDKTITGSPTPDFIWGMTNTFEYKNFDLSIQVNGVQGGEHMMTLMEGVLARSGGDRNTIYDYYDNYWRPDRIDAKYPAPNRKSWDGTFSRGILTFSSTYVNIQNIAFGYTLPKSLIGKFNLSNARLYATVQNAFLITRYPGYNPEVNTYGNSSLAQAIDAGGYPMTRTVSFGLNLSF